MADSPPPRSPAARSEAHDLAISFVVPHYDDWGRLRKLLDSIAAERASAGSVDVQTIVVDDASPCAGGDIEPLRAAYPWVDFYVNAANSGPAFSRNFGAAKARHGFVWFLDSDVILAEGSLNGMLALLRERPDLVGIGSGVGADAVSGEPFQKYKNYIEHAWQPAEGPTRSLDSKSFLLERSTFLEMGGFSAAFTFPGVEDYDLGYRLLSAGVPLHFTHRAKILHHHPRFWRQLELFYQRARDWVRLSHRHRQGTNDYATTRSEGALQIVAALIPLSAVGALFRPSCATALLALLLAWLFLNRRPLAAMRRAGEGPLFLLRCFAYSVALSYAVCLGAAVGLLTSRGSRADPARGSA